MGNEKIENRKKELIAESQELQKKISELDMQKTQMVQRALEIKGAYSELLRLEESEVKPIEVKP
jgi:chaperonin cofactor prefoldin